MGLIILQGDFGSALVFGVFLLVLFREGLSPLYLIIVFLLVLLSILALLFQFYLPHRRNNFDRVVADVSV